MIDKQLDLGLESPQRCRSRDRRRLRQSRAGWWFERMRQVVEVANPSTVDGKPEGVGEAREK